METWCSDCIGSNWRCSEPSSSTSRSQPIDLPCTSRKIGTHPTIMVSGHPRTAHGAFAWQMALERGRTRTDSLIVIAKDGDLFAFMGLVCCDFRLFPLQGWLLIWISTTSSVIMKACSLRSNVETHETLWWFALCILGWHWLFCSHGKLLDHTLHD
jgi:hypothetical protein